MTKQNNIESNKYVIYYNKYNKYHKYHYDISYKNYKKDLLKLWEQSCSRRIQKLN
jgi:hypothetical protein